MGLGQISSDAERPTHVLTVDQDMGQAGDRPSSGRPLAVGSGVPKGLQNDRRVLLTACLPISCHPSVEVQAVTKHSHEDGTTSEGTLRARGQVRKHVPDAPQDTQ